MITESEYKKALEICKKYFEQKKNEAKMIKSDLEKYGLIEFNGLDESNLSFRVCNLIKSNIGSRYDYEPLKKHWETREESFKNKKTTNEYLDKLESLEVQFEYDSLKKLTKRDIKCWRRCGTKSYKEILSFLISIGIFPKSS